MANQKMCLIGLLLFGFIAIAESGYGDPCDYGCNIDHGCCTEFPKGCDEQKFCVCKDRYSWDIKQQKCLYHKEIGNKCDPTEHVCPVGSTCLDGRCTCALSKEGSHDEEQCGLKHREKCKTTSECNQQRGHMTCQAVNDEGTKKRCLCADGYEWVKDEKHCLPEGVDKIACSTDNKCQEHCPAGMTCIGSKCNCLASEKFDTESRTCVPKDAMVGLGRGEHCSHITVGNQGTKFCAFGLTCFKCFDGAKYNVTAGHRCVLVPNINSSGRLYPTLFSTLLMAAMLLIFNP